MYRLMQRAAELDETFAKTANFSIDSTGHLEAEFADITQAIHIVQTEMGITGTTAKEAGTTIQGSVASMKSAWENLLTGLADGNADIEQLVDNLVTTIVGDGTETNLGVLGNILPAVQAALNGASTLISEAFPEIVGIIPTIINDNLPILASAAVGIIQSLMDGISQNQEMLFETIFGVVTYLAESFVTMLPQIVELGLDLIVSLANGISENLPEIIPAIVEIINQIMSTITENLPLLITSALEIIVSLANGIADSLPELIPTVIDVILQIVDTLTDPENLRNLLDAALAVLEALAEGLIENIDKLVDATFTIIENLVEFLLDPENITKLLQAALEIVLAIGTGLVRSIPRIIESVIKLVDDVIDAIVETDWGQVGEDVVNGLLEGLKNMWGSLTSWFSESWDGLVGDVKDFLGIHSPSRVFAGIGKNMALGVGEGWEDEFLDIQNDINKSLSFDDPSLSINASVSKIGMGTSGVDYGVISNGRNYSAGGVSIVQNIYSEAKTAADLMQEALYQQERAVLLGV